MHLSIVRALRGLAALVAVATLAACGGGDDTPATVRLTGVAATGAPIANASVKILNAKGESVTVRSGADGKYTADIANAAPFVLSVVDAASKVWYSYAAQAGVANITPLTTLALLDANAQKPLADLAAAWASTRLTEAQVLEAAKKVNANLRTQLQAQGLDPAKLNVFTAEFSANHTGLDAVLDAVRVNVACEASRCAQTITNPGGQVLVTWDGNIATTGITLSWTASTAGGGSTGGSVTVGLGSCKAPVAGTYSMVVQTSVGGVTGSIPDVCVDNLPGKPASQSEFCDSGSIKQQLPPGVEIVSCSYAGSTGTINARITQPVVLDYTVTYTFVLK